MGLDFDKTSAHAGLGAMIQRANYPLKNSSLGPPVKEDREVLPLHSTQHLERGFAVRQYREVFVRRGPFGGYGYSRQLRHNGLGRSVYLKAMGVREGRDQQALEPMLPSFFTDPSVAAIKPSWE